MRFFNLKYILSLLLPGALLSLNSCIMDNFDSYEGSLSPGDEAYVLIRIKSAEGKLTTRGTSWEGFSDDAINDQEEFEHIIGDDSYAMFFDKNKKLNSVQKLARYTHDELDGDASHEAVYRVKYEVPLTYEAPENPDELIGYCVVVLNSSPIWAAIESYQGDLSKLNQIVWSSSENPFSIGRSGAYFTMSNSIYESNGEAVLAQPFSAAVIQDAKDEFSWSLDKTINVYVERMVSKVSVDFTGGRAETETVVGPGEDGKIEERTVLKSMTFTPGKNNISVFKEIDADGIPRYTENDDTYQYEVKVTGWAINALDKKSYLFKNINPDASYFGGWNDAGSYRSYWSEDPDYDETGYPWQYRYAVDKRNIPYYSKNVDTNLLKNYSYNDIVGWQNFGFPVYVPENTFDFEYLRNEDYDNRRDVLCGSHLLITAELQTNIFGSMETRDLYRDRYGNFYRNPRECFIALVYAFNHELKTQIDMYFKAYNWVKDGAYQNEPKMIDCDGDWRLYYDGVELTEDFIKSTFPEDMDGFMIDATIKDGDGKIIFWNDKFSIRNSEDPTDIINLAHYTDKILNTGKYEKIVDGDATVNDLKNILFEWMGPVDHFKDGKMYYYVPVIHASNDIPGLVRNHWYKFEISGANEIGTSVDNDNDPIVPNKVPTKDMINFRIKILDWHEIETDVTFDFELRQD